MVFGALLLSAGCAGAVPGGSVTFTATPSRTLRWPSVTTTSFARSPETISTLPSRRWPMSTFCRAALPSTTFQTYLSSPTGKRASSGTIAESRASLVKSRTRANMPGRSLPSRLATCARITIERPAASMRGLMA